MGKSLILLLFIASLGLQAQNIDTATVPVWVDMMQDPSANFHETQKAFEIYWQNRDRQPGDGWKVFKRWEWFWSSRLKPDGTRIASSETRDAWEQWRIIYNQTNINSSDNTTGLWTEVGPRVKPNNGTGQPNGNGRLNGIAFNPFDTNTLWVGAPAGGLWKTTDGGSTWSSNTDMMPTLGVSSILIHPTNADTMWIGTGDRDGGDASGLGVYKSTDEGLTWNASNSGMGNRVVGAMVMYPGNPNYILAATSGGVYRSQNGGQSWSNEQSGNFKDIRFHPTNPNIVYATSSGDFFRSTNAGDTWTLITSGLPSNPQRSTIGVSIDAPDVVYLLISISSEFDGLYRSINAGVNFTLQSSSPNILGWSENGSGSGGQGWYDLCIAVDPQDADVIYTGGVNIWKSTDGGVTWDCAAHWVGSSTAASVHADQHWLEYSPYDGKLYNCNDGGIYYTNDGGVTWPELSSGLGISQIYKIGVSQNTDPLVLNGYQDNGTALWDDNIFRTERGGDGMECIIDYSDDNVMYATVYFGNIARSLNNGVSFGGFAANGTNGITEEGAWVTPFILHHTDPNTMFIGYKNVWRTQNAKASPPSFDQISNNLGGVNNNNIRQLRQSPADLNKLYVVRSNNTCFRSDNAMATTPTWFNMTGSLPGSGTIRDIEPHSYLPNTVWLLRNNTVYRSDNSGGSWYSINSGLPSITKNCLKSDPLSHEALYVGTDAGIYYIDSTLSTWAAYDDSLPANVEVTELEIYHAQGNWNGSKIRAATYGRGLWESPLYDPENIAPLAFMEVTPSTADLCGGDTVKLFNNSAYSPTTTTWAITPNSGFSYVAGTSASSMNPQLIFTQSGLYDVTLISSNSFGSDSATITGAISIQPGASLQWTDDFENDTDCSTNNCQLSCNIISWHNLENGVEDDIDFRINSGTTPSNSTGPSTDFDPGTSTGKYAYAEASFCFNQEALLESPCIYIEPSTSPEFKWAYHMNGGSMGSLNLDIYSNGSWTNLETISGNQGNNWEVDSVSITSYIGQSVKFRFRAMTGAAYTSDIAIDAVQITAAPRAEFQASDTTPCVNTIITLADSTNLNPTSWSWTIIPNTVTFENGTNLFSQNPDVKFNNPGTYSITMQASNAYGSDFESKTGYINVVQPSATLSSVSGSNSFCQEDSVQLSATPGFANYSFTLNGSTVQSGPQNALDLGPLNAGDMVSVDIIDSGGCSGQSNVLSIQIWDEPQAAMLADDEDFTICEGDSVEFSLIAIGGSSLDLYEFMLNNSSQGTTGNPIWQTNILADGDAVWGAVIDTNGCNGTSDTLQFTVNPIPSTPFIGLVIDSLESSVAGDQYQWSFDDSISLGFGQRYPKQGDGIYLVRVLENGCWSDWSDAFTITGLGNPEEFGLKVYPSPSRGLVTIEVSGLSVNDGMITITDLNGRVVMSQNQLIWMEGKTTMNIQNLAAGVYQLSLQLDDRQISLPVVKEN